MLGNGNFNAKKSFEVFDAIFDKDIYKYRRIGESEIVNKSARLFRYMLMSRNISKQEFLDKACIAEKTYRDLYDGKITAFTCETLLIVVAVVNPSKAEFRYIFELNGISIGDIVECVPNTVVREIWENYDQKYRQLDTNQRLRKINQRIVETTGHSIYSTKNDCAPDDMTL